MTTLTETGNTFTVTSYNLQVYNTVTSIWDEVVGETTPFTDLTYTHTGLTTGVDYTYRVRAQNIHGFGAVSDSLTVRADDTPGAPSEVTTAASGILVALTWSAPASDNGSAITTYRVYIKPEGNGAMIQEQTYCVAD